MNVHRVHALGDTNFLFVFMTVLLMVSLSANYVQDLIEFVHHYQGKHYKGFIIPGNSVVKLDLKRNRGLHLAAKNGYEDIVAHMLKLGYPVDMQSAYWYSCTPLQLAAKYNRTNVVTLLLDKNPQVDAYSPDNNFTALHYATVAGNMQIVRVLLQHGAQIDIRSKANKTALHHALEKKHEELARFLLSQGAHPMATTSWLENPLHIASEYGCNSSVKLLLYTYQVPVDAITKTNKTSLMIACSKGHEDIVRTLITAGANISTELNDGKTPLIVAAKSGHDAIVRILIAHGASVSHRCNEGKTALHYAVEHRRVSTLHLLLAQNASIDALDKKGRSPLMMALKRQRLDLIPILLQAGANTQYQSYSSRKNALHIAAERNCAPATLTLLISSGIDVNSKTTDKKTALHFACMRGYSVVTKTLLQLGANIEAIDGYGKTPIIYAVETKQIETVRILLAANASITRIDKSGQSPLDYAMAYQSSQPMIADMLIAAQK